MTDIIKSILAINPKAEVSINADDIKQITWHNGTTQQLKQIFLQSKKNFKQNTMQINIKEIERSLSIYSEPIRRFISQWH